MGLLDGIKNIITGKGADLVKNVGGIIDDLNLSGEEKEKLKIALVQETNRHTEVVLQESTKQIEAELKDIQDARSSNVQLQTSDKTPLFVKIVPYIIACFTGVIWGAITIYIIASMMNIIKRDPSVNFEGVLGIYAGITGTFGIILNFFFGTSRSSEDKQKMIQEMMKK